MVYNQKFVVVIKVNGKVLREVDDIVHIPFGSEYAITLKNLNSVKAVAKIEVDGSDTLDGHQVIVPPNETVIVEGFMKGSKVRNKFKFIEKTSQISAFRGDKVSDGLVRVTYQFEYVWPDQTIYRDPSPSIYGPSYGNRFEPTSSSGDSLFNDEPTRSAGFSCNNATKSRRVSSTTLNNSNTPKSFKKGGSLGVQCCAVAAPINDSGITVKGSQSVQRFSIGTVGMLDPQKHIIVLQLKGKAKNMLVKKIVTVKTKVQCVTCGKRSKSKNKFCNNCGTSLV